MSFAALECDRLSIDLALAATRERVPALERELAEALENQLAGALAPYASGRDDGVQLFIERLVIEDAIGGAWDLEVIVRKVAARIAAAVSAEIDGGTGLRFRDRAEFVAAFLAALADGSAWGRWWFGEFEGFRALSASNAIRSAVLAEHETGFKALARLTEDSARRVIDAMAPADAARVVAACRARVTTEHLELHRLWSLSQGLARGIEADPRRWLLALLECEQMAPQSAGEEAVRVLQGMRALREIAAGMDFSTLASEVESARDAIGEIADRCGLQLEWLEAAPEKCLDEIERELRAAVTDHEGASFGWTEYGGAFILLNRMARFGWFEKWRSVLSDTDVRILACAVIAEALEPGDAARILSDSALLGAMNIADVMQVLRRRRRAFVRALRDAGIAAAAQPAPRSRRGALAGGRLGIALAMAAARLLDDFAAHVPGLAGSSPEYLRCNVLALPAAIEVHANGARVRLGHAPLDVLLVLAGCKRSSCDLPGAWSVELCEEFHS